MRSRPPVHGALARAEALTAGHPKWTEVTTWPIPRLRILITGGRNVTDAERIRKAILEVAPDHGQATIIHGAATGADTLAGSYAMEHPELYDVEVYPAGWSTHGKAAGPIRNQAMVDTGADICLAFPDPESVGTWDCVKRAVAAGIPVNIR